MDFHANIFPDLRGSRPNADGGAIINNDQTALRRCGALLSYSFLVKQMILFASVNPAFRIMCLSSLYYKPRRGTTAGFCADMDYISLSFL